MVGLPGGTYAVGAAKRRVTIKPYCLDATEVVADAYATCVRGGQCSDAGVKCGDEATYGVSGSERHPMNCVDWSQADTYCRTQGKRLPTEEEWEWAARGTTRGWKYPWGNDDPPVSACWSGASKKAGTCVVGTFPASDSAEGIHDLAGNVWEWTASRFAPNDPERVGRGGGWRGEDALHLRAANRGKNAPSLRVTILGFRCAR